VHTATIVRLVLSGVVALGLSWLVMMALAQRIPPGSAKDLAAWPAEPRLLLKLIGPASLDT
jgi:hypothetical protein